MSAKLVIVPLVLGVFLGGLSWISLWFAPLAVLAFGCGGYFAYAQRTFSTGGGDVQSNVQGLILIVCVGAAAARFSISDAATVGSPSRSLRPTLTPHVTGVDRWGSSWEFSKAACERNAAAEGVAERVTFLKASAAALPFDEAAFDVVISNLVFHEVRDVADKKLLLRRLSGS